MKAVTATSPNDTHARGRWPSFRPGDLVTSRSGYPVLYEILTLHDDSLLRVRGLNWAPGYSAVVDMDDVRPVTGILNNASTR